MLLKVKVYVGNVTNLSDARYCAGMGVDMLGFPIGTSGKTQLSIETFQEIAEWVTGPSFVFEYSDHVDQALLEKVTQLETIQYYRVSSDLLGALPPLLEDKPLVVDSSLEGYSKVAQFSNVKFVVVNDNLDHERIATINQITPVLVPIERVSSALNDIDTLPITGIVLEGTAEEKPGQKDYGALADVLEQLEID